ncbi:S-layer homology domain-containing protein [uncultured Microbacterium sp.]|uniref:S-layer homology domain-containing protein n=1 Tax=uncultured Microbacterium sp. TaxID=191216 RepID=UPI00261AC87C|nr:S-layer homology domain-containing protein [uncultured Microbacterium sp.]
MIPRIIARSSGRARPVSRLAGAVIAVIALVGSLLAANPAIAAVPVAQNAQPASQIVDTGTVKAAAVVGFNAENIISDALFYDNAAMTAAEIQAFLNSKIGTCKNGKCLNVLNAGISSRGEVRSQSTGNLICSAIQGGTMKVSELIYRVQVACGISAKVILATLQKEQGLTTSTAPSDWNLKAAMGASCPDTAPCDPSFAGVGPQILKGAQQLKTYKAANFAKQPGRNYVAYSPNASCGGTTLNIQNYATAALYNYTPYQPNAAALAAGYGLGNSCSAYGNRNFYNYYTQWFGSTQRPATDTVFADVSSVGGSVAYSEFASDITWLEAQGISSGWTVGGYREYRPELEVTRSAMAAFLYRLAGSPAFEPPQVSPYHDVATTAPFYREIAWLSSVGVSTGSTTEGGVSFDPDAPIQRDAMAAFLYRFAGSPASNADGATQFSDVPADAEFVVEMGWLAQRQISAGWAAPDGSKSFRPAAYVTRGAMAAFLHRVDTYLNPFSDVSSRANSSRYSEFASEIAWSAAEGISTGWSQSDGSKTYRPSEPVLRSAMAAFLFRFSNGGSSTSGQSVTTFADVPASAPFATEISWLASRGISTGWVSDSQTNFRPDAPVTRDAMAAFIYRLAGSPQFVPPATSPFSDVTPLDPFYKEMAWLSTTEITTGWETGTNSIEFRPSANITRDAMAAFLERLRVYMTT